MAKKKYKKTKRAAELGTATVIVLGLGAAVAGVALYNHFKATPAPAPLTPGLTPNLNPNTNPVLGTVDNIPR